MSAGSTPGPWRFEAGVEENEGEFYVCHPATICDSTTVCNPASEADARLIAAAPDLYAALNLLRDEMSVVDSWWSDLRNAVDKADDALAKARGEA